MRLRRPTLARLIVELRPGARFDALPHRQATRRGLTAPARRSGHAALDATLCSCGDIVSVGHVFRARRGVQEERLAPVELAFAGDEHALGLPRTLEVVMHTDRPVPTLLGHLRRSGVVDSALENRWVSSYADPATASAEPRSERGRRWAFDEAGFNEALRIEPGDPAVTIAVLDTGVDAAHPELEGRIAPGYDLVDTPAESVADLGVELLGDHRDRDDDPSDEVGHGTNVAALIAARGLHMAPGAAGQCRVLPIRVLAAARRLRDGRVLGMGTQADINAGMKEAVDRGAAVLNLSLGSTDGGPGSRFGAHPHDMTIRYARERQAVVLAASGNSGAAQVFYPAATDGVLAVGAADVDGREAAFSTRGDHVAVLAPGVAVFSAAIGGGYRFATGTSFAAPYAASVAALVVSHLRRRGVVPREGLVREMVVLGARMGPDAHKVVDAGRTMRLVRSALSEIASSELGPSRRDVLEGRA